MLESAYYIESLSYNPHENLALEDALLDKLPDNSIIFFLWQNANTVVIGRNQNAHKECDLQKMKEENCLLARRSTGGGAVYHDLGNLNFSFITEEDEHSLVGQTEIIIDALKQFGINATLSGRNDIEVDGLKISGNAYLHRNQKKLHHGTLMVNVNTEKMTRYLRPSQLKLQSRGVDSVRSRICNLSDFIPGISIQEVKESLKSTFESLYQLPLEYYGTPADLDYYLEQYKSDNFIFGPLSTYTNYLEHRFDFGEINLYYTLKDRQISDIVCYSDSMEVALAPTITTFFEGMILDDEDFLIRHQVNPQLYLQEIYQLLKEHKNEV